MIRRAFRRATGKPADSFDQVDEMITRKLPIPGFDESSNKFIQFTARRTKEGYWTIGSKYNLKSMTAGLMTATEAFAAAAEKHIGKPLAAAQETPLNFDTAFLILRDLEESLLKFTKTVTREEPTYHYMEAYRLLPKQFQEGLDEIYFDRNDKRAILPILPPPAPKPTDSGAKKPPNTGSGGPN